MQQTLPTKQDKNDATSPRTITPRQGRRITEVPHPAVLPPALGGAVLPRRLLDAPRGRVAGPGRVVASEDLAGWTQRVSPERAVLGQGVVQGGGRGGEEVGRPLVVGGGGRGGRHKGGGEGGVVGADGGALVQLGDDDVVGGVAQSDVPRCAEEKGGGCG